MDGVRQDLEATGDDKVIFAAYDIDAPASDDMVKRYRITGVPTFLVLDANQNEVSRFHGLGSGDELKDKFKRLTK